MAGKELQIETDWKFQRKMWKAERIGAWLLAILLAATVAGLLGGGGALLKPPLALAPVGGLGGGWPGFFCMGISVRTSLPVSYIKGEEWQGAKNLRH